MGTMRGAGLGGSMGGLRAERTGGRQIRAGATGEPPKPKPSLKKIWPQAVALIAPAQRPSRRRPTPHGRQPRSRPRHALHQQGPARQGSLAHRRPEAAAHLHRARIRRHARPGPSPLTRSRNCFPKPASASSPSCAAPCKSTSACCQSRITTKTAPALSLPAS